MRLLKPVLFYAFVAIIALALAAGAVAAWGIYAYRTTAETRPTDAAIVLGAATWGEEPSPVFRERINHAVALYRQGYAKTIIFTGGAGSPSELPEAEVARRYAVAAGVAESDILVETRSRITEENLRYARAVASERGLATFLIGSDPLHMKRAMLMARDLGLKAYPSPTPTTRYQSPASQLPFLARETFFYLGYLLWRPFAPAPRGSP